MMRPGTGELIPFGDHHVDFWNWVWTLKRGTAPAPFVGIWPRGGAKSTSAEMAGALVGARRTRRYVLYVCETQERAEDHVSNVAGMFESEAFARRFPHVAHRGVNKYGNPKGWQRKRLHTHSGFVVDAVGFDSAARGAKIDEVRPDLMIFDDIDGDSDTVTLIEKKIRLLCKKFLPAGSPDLAVLMVQNLIHPNTIFSRLAGVSEYSADFLTDRIVSGPYPALYDFSYEELPGPKYVVTGGRPLWAGMDLARCQLEINKSGLSSFLTECQQEVEAPPGGMFSHLTYERIKREHVPDLVKVVVWVDPAVSDTDHSDSHGIQVDGLGDDDKIYRLYSWEQRASPERALRKAILLAYEYGALTVGVETDQGGDTWRVLYEHILEKLQSPAGITDPEDGVTYRVPRDRRAPAFCSEKAGSGVGNKSERAQRMLAGYETARFVHVIGTHQILERALHRFPRTKPYDLVDAAFWSFHDLAGKRKIRKAAPISITRASPWRAA